jgi:phosphonate transport system substrate-binding protein
MRKPAPMTARLLGLALTPFIVAGCATAGPTPLAHPITFGIARPIGEEAARASAKELTDYFNQKFGPGSSVQIFPDVGQLGDALAKGTVDAAWLTPGAYIHARDVSTSIHPLMKLMRGGASSYRSVFFARADGGGSLASFRDKRLALVAQGSMSGRLYPLAHLKKLGIDPRVYFGQVISGKDHKEVCELVATGRAELGATLSDDHGTIVAEPDGCREAGLDPHLFSVVAATGPVPNDVIAARGGLDPDSLEHVRQLFSDMPTDDAGKAAMKLIFRADGFAPASDHDFDTVREMEKLIGP